MNTLFRSINESSLLFMDMECVKASKKLDPKSREFKEFQYWKRDRDSEETKSVNELQVIYDKTAALNPIFGKICCISVGYIVDNSLKIRSIIGEEAEILYKYGEITAHPRFQKIVSWNGAGFDSPYIEKRAMINGVLLPDKVTSFGVKPWESSQIDLMMAFKGHSFYSDSLAAVTYAFGIESPKNDLVGSQVSEVYYKDPKKNILRISRYCDQDVFALAQVFRKMAKRKELDGIIYQ